MADPNSIASLSLMQHLHTTNPPASGSPSAADIHSSQIQRKSLILRPTSPDPTSQDARSVRRKKRLTATVAKRKARKPLSAKAKRKLGVYDLELRPGSDSHGRKKTQADWTVWKGLWRLWVGYVHEVLSLPRGGEMKILPSQLGPKITSLDLHGSMLRVVKSACFSLVGIWGVCVRETKSSIILVDSSCIVRRICKKGVVFGMAIPLSLEAIVEEDGKTPKQLDLDDFIKEDTGRIMFEISGSAIECRPADRATKKFKGRKYDGL